VGFLQKSQESMNNSNQRGKRFLFNIVLFVLAAYYCAPYADAQALAETAATTALSAGTTVAVAKSLSVPNVEIRGGNGGSGTSPHLQAWSGPLPQVVNRRAFEQHAGADAGKLLIRSATGSVSQVWIDDKYVGPTPLLQTLAPGKYHLFVRGQNNESGELVVNVLPRETREVVPALNTPYRSKFTIR
jgi:hypothetical protein